LTAALLRIEERSLGTKALQDSSSYYYRYLDGWRGLAITVVLLGHFWLDALWPGVSGLGVSLFFVLSGRLMAEILFLRDSDLPGFFARRFARIYPALLCFVVIVALAFSRTSDAPGVLPALGALTFTLNYAMIYSQSVALLDHIWSLCVEEHGYAVLALVALLARRRLPNPPLVLLVLGAAALANGILRADLLGQNHFFVFWRSDVQVAPIFLSAGLFLLLRGHPVSPWTAPLALTLAVNAELWGSTEAVAFGARTLLLALAAATLDRSYACFRSLLEVAPLRLLGLWSFSIYLWQQPFYKLAHHGTLSVVLAVVAGCAAGLTSYYLVERPARGYLNRRWPAIFTRVRAGLSPTALAGSAKSLPRPPAAQH
jgi:peptidoglycan/LPS O-acetylase OafA/YrhL